MIARACRSNLYHFSSRYIRVAILFIVAVAALLAARDYIRTGSGNVTYKKHKTVPKWNPAHNKDLFLVPAVRPKARHVEPLDRTKVLAKLAQAKAPEEHPLLAFQSSRGTKHRSKEDAAMVEYMASKVTVEIEVLTNTEGIRTCWFQTTLTNTGTATISYGHWEIYFHSVRFLQLFDFPYPNGILIKDSPLRLFHVQGSLYRLVPEAELFHGWTAGDKITLHLEAKAFLISRSDFFPNWYVTAPNITPLLIQSAADDNLTFVQAFDAPRKWKRRKNDQYNPFTAEDRFNRNLVIRDLGHPGSHIIPTPVQVSFDPIKKVQIDTKTWKIFHNLKFSEEVSYLADLLKLQVSNVKPASNYISFVEETVLPLKRVPTTVEEAYSVTVDSVPNIITLSASHKPGAFYAAVTLYSLTSRVNTGLWEVPVGKVADQPRFKYRGLHLDVARNFHPKEEVLRLLDVMAIYKLNKFHLHLSDDEGWRIEIPGLSELTQVGSKRCHGDVKERCLFPALGSGPDAVYPGTGYYTVRDYQEILRYADHLHIQVIPEIDMPGHSQAAIVAMEARYYDLREKGQGLEAREYLLSDLADKSVYLSAQSFTKTALNPCLESTYTFLRHVMESLKVMHSDIQPLTFYHFGGDEVPKGAWVNSSACLTSSLQPDVHTPQKWKEYFLVRLAKIARQLDLELGAWEDGIIDQNTSVPFNIDLFGSKSRHIYTYPWNNKWEYGIGNQAYNLANAGYKVVMSQGTHLYFDHAQEPDPEEVGLYWATRFIDLQRVFSFIPAQMYWNADLSIMGEPLTKDQICNGKECLTLQNPENIVGMECHLWGELLRSRDVTDHQMFPRVIAMAERAWHHAPWESESDVAARRTKMDADWSRFVNTIGYKEYPYLDSLGIKYRIPPPGAVVKDKKLLVNSEAPGLEIQYSLDFGKTWRDARGGPELTGDNTIFLRTMSTDRKRWSRIIKLQYDHDQVKVKQRARDGELQVQQQNGVNSRGSKQTRSGTSRQQTPLEKSSNRIYQETSAMVQSLQQKQQQILWDQHPLKRRGRPQILPGNSEQQPGQVRSPQQTGQVKLPQQNMKLGKSSQQMGIRQFQQQNGRKEVDQVKYQQTGKLLQQPGKLQQQPGKLHQQPGKLHQQPGKLQQQPGELQQQPGKLQQQPGELQQQPGKLQQQPGELQQQPGEFQQPGKPVKVPRVSQQIVQNKGVLVGQQQAGPGLSEGAFKQKMRLKSLQGNIDTLVKKLSDKTINSNFQLNPEASNSNVQLNPKASNSNAQLNPKTLNVQESLPKMNQAEGKLTNLLALRGKSSKTFQRKPEVIADEKPAGPAKVWQGQRNNAADKGNHSIQGLKTKEKEILQNFKESY
ncbi:beta-hexosaminidase-like [Pecten maximus]|uniref:beta-hexosaminidase-like n=1 Tax=Pecten maximus TaxID=6579 RepID=UPI0014583D17|nr:beta-hexosaminidase-like [Pecten maximus]